METSGQPRRSNSVIWTASERIVDSLHTYWIEPAHGPTWSHPPYDIYDHMTDLLLLRVNYTPLPLKMLELHFPPLLC